MQTRLNRNEQRENHGKSNPDLVPNTTTSISFIPDDDLERVDDGDGDDELCVEVPRRWGKMEATQRKGIRVRRKLKSTGLKYICEKDQ